MKKMKANKLLSVILFGTATLLAGVFYGVSLLHAFGSVKAAVTLDPRSNNINFKLNEVVRGATDFDKRGDNSFDYQDEAPYIAQDSAAFGKELDDNEFHMLNNYSAEQNLKSGTAEQEVKNVYIGIGSTFTEVNAGIEANESYGSRGNLIDVTNVEATLNGQAIKLNDSTEDTVALPGLQGQQTVRYWYQYIDLKQIKHRDTGEVITNASGLYTFTFWFNVFDYSSAAEEWSIPLTGRTFTISFYLLDQSDYAYEEAYPSIAPATKGNPTSQSKILQYFYNYTEENNSTITYDASLYNISYVREKSPLKEITESSFSVTGGTGTVTYRTYTETAQGRQLLSTWSETLSVTNDTHFKAELTLPELGSYEITIQYVVKANNSFVVIDRNDIPAYDLRNNIAKYEDGTYAKGKYLLHVFGVKAYFVKGIETLDFENRDTNTFSNITPYLSTIASVAPGYASKLDLNQISYPTTNLPLVFFDYYATYSVGDNNVNENRAYRYTNGFDDTNPASTRIVTKDTQITQAGYHEIVFKYTFPSYSTADGNSETEHFQVFAFRINLTTPNVLLKTTNDPVANLTNDANLDSDEFTNKNVYAVWNSHNYFTSVITASIARYNFDGGLVESKALSLTAQDHAGVNKTLTPFFEQEGRYVLTVYHYSENTNLNSQYTFIIDKTAIGGIGIHAIDKTSNGDDYYVINDNIIVNLQDKLLINQPFTLAYSPKASGAEITTKYIKVPFKNFVDGAKTIEGTNYITALYQIDPDGVSSANKYPFSYADFMAGHVSFASAFDDNNSYVYIFTITDAAGNTAVKNVIYDLTTPEVIVTPTPDNPYNVITKDTTVFWGTHKAVKIAGGSDITIGNHPLKNLITNNPNGLFQQIGDDYYMLVPITNVTITSDTKTATRSYNSSDVGFKTSVLFAPKAGGTQTDSFFIGEDSFVYSVTDASHIKSNSTIGNSNVKHDNIMINLDNALAFAYGKSFNANYGDSISYEYGEALNWNRRLTNADQLRVTYLPGEENTGYHVKSFTYKYYPKDTSAYINIADKASADGTFEENEIRPFFPYSPTSAFANFRPVTISSLQIPGQTEGSNLRLVSEVINPIQGELQQLTQEGLYVFRREYNQTGDPSAYEDDSVIRFYFIVVDREQNINILGSSEDIDISDTTKLNNIQPDNILYQTGSGIYFKFTNNASDNVRKSAKQIQQEKNQTSRVNMFETNKLPVKFNLPVYKFNDEYLLKNASDYNPAYDSYITTVKNNNIAPLYYIVTMNVNGNPVRIIDTLNNFIHTTYVARNINSVTGANEFSLKHAGVYDVELLSSKSAEQNVAKSYHNMTSYTFSFTIVHESPTGTYASLVNDTTLANLTVKSQTIQKVNFASTNNKDLKFVFEDSSDEFKAKIDFDNLSVSRKDKSGATSVIYSKTNGVENFAGVTGGQPNPLVFIREDKDIVRQLYKYTLDLTYFVNQSNFQNFATYTVNIHYMGSQSDYQVGDSNYYSRNFEIIVDREKPKYNREQLNSLDALNYNKTNVASLNDTNYFYAINKDFNFIRNASYGGELDSFELFVRPLLINPITGYPNYLYTITPDNTGTDESQSANPKFSDTNPLYYKYTYDSNSTLGIIYKNAENMFSALGQSYGTTYFEIVERDEAQNYSVYAVKYIYDSITPVVNFEYQPIGYEGTIAGDISGNNLKAIVNGNSLKITSIASEDLFVKAIVSYGTTTKTVYNNPNANNPVNDFSDFISKIHAELAFTKEVTQVGYKLSITFVNRFGQNTSIDYLVPGDVLKPSFTDIGITSFKITIPNENESTRITQFRVWKFENGAWSTNSLITDSLGNYLRPGEPNGPSLGGSVYEFGVGEYKFELIDNFGRGADMQYYYGIGVVNNVNDINYGGSQKTLDSKIYTAGPVTLKYQVNLYELTLYKSTLQPSGEMGEEVLVTNIANETGIIISNASNGVRTIEFRLNAKNSQINYRAVLFFYRTEQTTVYDFMLYTKLPNIQLTTRSGSLLNPASSPFTENILLNWSTTPLDFNSTVRLVRTYLDGTGKIQTQDFGHVGVGYEVHLPGSYTASISNSLGYTDNAKTVTFQLIEGQIVVFDVITVQNGVERKVGASPITSFIRVGSENKILHKYYILSQFKGGVSGYSYQVRLNTDKNLTSEVYQTNENSVIYKIYGNVSFGYERFIEIVFVPTPAANDDFTALDILSPIVDEESGEITSHEAIEPQRNIRTNAKYLDISFKSYNELASDPDDKGNIIYADYYFNNVFVKHIYNLNAVNNVIRITNSGVHSFKFYDLAGNVRLFNGQETMNITLLNNILFTANEEEPIENIIVNNQMDIDIISRSSHDTANSELYSGEIIVTATLDGKPTEVLKVGTQGYKYRFTQQGYYEITMSTEITINNVQIPISTKYTFTIINSNQKLIAFNLPSSYEFVVDSVIFQGTPIDTIDDKYVIGASDLWITPSQSSLVGNYVITLRAYVQSLQVYKTFTFNVHIHDETPTITASIPFGTDTTKSITITYAPLIIYDAIGESKLIVRTEAGTVIHSVNINENAPNQSATLTISAYNTYWVELFTIDDKLVLSHKLTINEPLNTTATIVIIIASIIVIGTTITFIIIRRRLKFR